MPELPEVETIVRDLQARKLKGCVIERARVFWARSIAVPPVESFLRSIRGRRITAVSRRAKFIVLSLDEDKALLIHLRMTGRINLEGPEIKPGPHVRVLLQLTDGRQLHFTDTRKFGKWYLLPNESAFFERLGPEPLEASFTVSRFTECLKGRNRQLKPLLLDQSFVAGLGNIYVDEALWQARLHPRRLSGSLKTADQRNLHKAIRDVLRRGIQNMGTTLGTTDTNFYSVGKRRGRNQDALKVFRRTGEPCPRCKTAIERIMVGQRSTHLCPKCQAG